MKPPTEWPSLEEATLVAEKLNTQLQIALGDGFPALFSASEGSIDSGRFYIRFNDHPQYAERIADFLAEANRLIAAAQEWHYWRSEDRFDIEQGFRTSDMLHAAVKVINLSPHDVPTRYRCTICRKRDDVHRFTPCDGGEWEAINNGNN